MRNLMQQYMPMRNKRSYSNEVAVLDMSTFILHNTLKTMTALVDAIVNETS